VAPRHEQGQAADRVALDLVEGLGGVAEAEVPHPPAQEGVQLPHGVFDRDTQPLARRELTDAFAGVRVGVAEDLPFPDGVFDVVLAQLVVQMLDDAPHGVREMCRVTGAGGAVAGSGEPAASWPRAYETSPPA
jgi:SAM-dependent methyltransferase